MAQLKRRTTGVSVSVVIPVKDNAEHLRRCLRALTSQRIIAADEIIVVDNGSVDHSASVALSMGVRLVFEDIPGIGAAASAGYDAAQFDIIARLDADSVPDADWIENIHAAFDHDPMLVGVTGAAHFVDGPRMFRRLGASLYLTLYYLLVGVFFARTPLFESNCAFRREDWREVRDRVHRTDPMMHDDVDLSSHFGPNRRITIDRAVRAGISSRPFSGPPRDIALLWRRGFDSRFAHDSLAR